MSAARYERSGPAEPAAPGGPATPPPGGTPVHFWRPDRRVRHPGASALAAEACRRLARATRATAEVAARWRRVAALRGMAVTKKSGSFGSASPRRGLATGPPHRQRGRAKAEPGEEPERGTPRREASTQNEATETTKHGAPPGSRANGPPAPRRAHPSIREAEWGSQGRSKIRYSEFCAVLRTLDGPTERLPIIRVPAAASPRSAGSCGAWMRWESRSAG